MNILYSSFNLEEVTKNTLGNEIVSRVVEEAAWNYMQNRTDDNLEVRGWLNNFAKEMCTLCDSYSDKVPVPNFDQMEWREKFLEDSWMLFTTEWLEMNIPKYSKRIKEELWEKIVLPDNNVQYFLAKIIATVTQIFFAYYHNFDYNVLRMSEEEFVQEVIKNRSSRDIILPLSNDPIENNKRIEKTVKDIKDTLDQEQIRKN